MRFGEKIKRIMFENNLTQQQFADKIGSKHPAISRWINGTSKNPTLETLEKISKAFNIPISYLSDDNQENFEEKTKSKNTEKSDLELVLNLIEKQNELLKNQNKAIEKISKKLDKELSFIKSKLDK